MQEGKDCVQGLRLRHHYMLCGALLRVWGRIAAVMADVTSSSYLQIVRLKTKDKKKQVGERARVPAGRGGGRRACAPDPEPTRRRLRAPSRAGIKIPEGCVRRVLQELQLMDADVKRKNARSRAFAAPLPALPALCPLALPCGPGEVLDLTYSPPAQAFPPPSPFAFPPPPLPPPPCDPAPVPSGLLLGAADRPADPAASVHQGCDINFKEVLEDMLRSLNAVPSAEPSGPPGIGAGAGAGGGAGPERQSVIQFSPPFPSS